MANWSTLKAAIASIIKTNGNKEITGQLLQNVLNNIVSSVGENSTFAGIATPITNPGVPDGNVFYLATEAGTYSNFSGIEIASEEAVILEWRGSWTKKITGLATAAKLTELENNIILFNSNKNIGKNRFNKDSMYNIPSSVINGNGDILTQDVYSQFIVTHPILINKSETLYANHAATGTVYSAIYGIDGRVIETYSDKKAISYVDGAAFVQFTFFATDINVLQVEVGESETSYEPYTETKTTDEKIEISQNVAKDNYLNKAKKSFGKNRYNAYDEGIIEGAIIGYNGDIEISDSYNSFFVTGKIPIYQGETLFCNKQNNGGVVFAALYDIYDNAVKVESSQKLTYQNTAVYARFTLMNSDRFGVTQVEVGESETEYTDYTETNDTNNYVNRNYISKKIGKNRFDKNDKNVLLNYAMWWDGSLHETPDMAVTGFIPIEYNQALYCNSAHESTVYSAQYDKDFKYIPNSAKTSKLQVGATNAKWVRYTIPLNRLNDTQVEEGVSSTNYEPYTEFSGVDFNNKLAGRKILWLGTSIPAGSTYMVKLNGKEVQNNYPKMVGELLGCTVYNEAVGSSALKTGLKDNVSDDNPLGFKTGTGGGFYFTEVCLMMTAEEKEDLINNWSSYRVKYGWSDSPETLSELSKAVIRACSYENKVIPYLDGRRELPDLIVIDHGHNDGVPMSGDAFGEDITSLNDRQTFFGAYNLLIDVIRSYHPNMRIVQCGHFSNVNFSDDEYSQGKEEVVKGQIAISDYNGIPIIPLWEIDGWASKRKIKSTGYWTIDDGDYSSLNWGIWTDKGGIEKEYTPNTLHCCDGMHPHSDMSGLSNIVLARSIAGWIKANIWGD